MIKCRPRSVGTSSRPLLADGRAKPHEGLGTSEGPVPEGPAVGAAVAGRAGP